MTTLHETIQTQRTEAMKAKDEVRLRTLRSLLAEFTNENVANKKKPDEMLDDETAMSVIMREAKKRKDSIEQFEKGGRQELADSEKAELAILEEFLPEQMSEEEVRTVVQEKIDALGVSGKSDMGKVMAAVMSELKGKADGSTVKKVVEELLG